MILEPEVPCTLGQTVLNYKCQFWGDGFCFSHVENYLGNNFLASLGNHIKTYLQALTSIAQYLWASGYLHLSSAWYWQAAMKSWWLEGWLLGALHMIFQKCKRNTDFKHTHSHTQKNDINLDSKPKSFSKLTHQPDMSHYKILSLFD